MKNMKFWRTALVASLVLTVMLSVTGGTIAWFTDTVESNSNIIKSGTLDVEMEYKAKQPDEYQDASTGSIFNYKLWEPGYTDVKYVKISNAGDLAFKFQLNIKTAQKLPGTEESEYNLADKIDVYAFPVGTDFTVPTRDVLDHTNAAYAGTVSALMADVDGAAHGVLLPAEGKGATDVAAVEAPKGSVEYCIVLKMQEEAGNEYQNLSIGDGFVVELEATQFTYEKDAFDEKYDLDAGYSKIPSAVVNGLDQEIVEAVDLVGYGSSMSDANEPLNVGYMFATTDSAEEGAANPYAKWHADFVVSFDKPVAANVIGLAGSYGDYGTTTTWLGFDLNATMIQSVTGNADATQLPANTPVRLLGEAAASLNNGNPIYVNYEELCGGVVQFLCGAYDIDENAAKGITMTVDLRLYEVEFDAEQNSWNTNEIPNSYITIGSYKYTF